MKEKTEKKKCPFFDVCAAYIIREKRKENWRQRFCFVDFENCVHYQDRNQIKAFITRAGERIRIL